jgi:hypothetical protein
MSAEQSRCCFTPDTSQLHQPDRVRSRPGGGPTGISAVSYRQALKPAGECFLAVANTRLAQQAQCLLGSFPGCASLRDHVTPVSGFRE